MDGAASMTIPGSIVTLTSASVRHTSSATLVRRSKQHNMLQVHILFPLRTQRKRPLDRARQMRSATRQRTGDELSFI
jgi:hypothetical protein